MKKIRAFSLFLSRYLTFFYIPDFLRRFGDLAGMRMRQRNGPGFVAICEAFFANPAWEIGLGSINCRVNVPRLR